MDNEAKLKTERIVIRLSAKDREAVERMAERREVSKSTIVREAIKKQLSHT